MVSISDDEERPSGDAVAVQRDRMNSMVAVYEHLLSRVREPAAAAILTNTFLAVPFRIDRESLRDIVS